MLKLLEYENVAIDFSWNEDLKSYRESQTLVTSDIEEYLFAKEKLKELDLKDQKGTGAIYERRRKEHPLLLFAREKQES